MGLTGPGMEPPGPGKPQTPVLTVACRMLRSPSHESVTTDLSLFSVSSLATDAGAGRMRLVAFKSYNDGHLVVRGPSPNPDSKVPASRFVNFLGFFLNLGFFFQTGGYSGNFVV